MGRGDQLRDSQNKNENKLKSVRNNYEIIDRKINRILIYDRNLSVFVRSSYFGSRKSKKYCRKPFYKKKPFTPGIESLFPFKFKIIFVCICFNLNTSPTSGVSTIKKIR